MATYQHLAGKTGGASKLNGIGAATALALAKHGANVLIHYNSNATAAEQVATEVRKLGVQAVPAKADASSESFGTDLVSAALNGLNTKTIDIIVNNAGVAMPHPNIGAVDVEA